MYKSLSIRNCVILICLTYNMISLEISIWVQPQYILGPFHTCKWRPVFIKHLSSLLCSSEQAPLHRCNLPISQRDSWGPVKTNWDILWTVFIWSSRTRIAFPNGHVHSQDFPWIAAHSGHTGSGYTYKQKGKVCLTDHRKMHFSSVELCSHVWKKMTNGPHTSLIP